MTRSGAGSAADPFTLDVADDGIDTAELADDAVTTDEIGTLGATDANKVLGTDAAGDPQWQNPAVIAMGKVDAAAIAENASGATVVRNGLGDYTVTLDTAVLSADYIIQLTLQNAGANTSIEVITQTANNFTVQISQTFIDNITTPGTPVLDSNQIDAEWFFTITDF
ncbi:hypothetical protein FVB32_00575 [Flagellimonas hymeniacidonis]|uniref:Uncharacterized protein n=1 Tax=Flagellimonas hymeniacidonis TaxID=2603628 RepID=A0A5C8V685_9FLAO|nr:hypothetical protein FVB32_00575 [Flagellimonas hymeniacidonis]